MSQLSLSPEELLTTTRSVRKRLDFSRPVAPEVIQTCLELAVQAPTAGNSQGWQFVVVTDPAQRLALGAIYRKGYQFYRQQMAATHPLYTGRSLPPEHTARLSKVRSSSEYLAEHLHEAPVLLVPCIWGRVEEQSAADQAAIWGSILPAVWSFMLAARLYGLGTAWTAVHLYYEQEAAEVLGIPFEQVTQAALIPLAYPLGTAFKPAPRLPLEAVVHWERWRRWPASIRWFQATGSDPRRRSSSGGPPSWPAMPRDACTAPRARV